MAVPHRVGKNNEVPARIQKLPRAKEYPGVGLDSNFVLPDRIDTAKVGLHKLSITQK